MGSGKPQGSVGHTAIYRVSQAIRNPGHLEADLRVKLEKGAKAISARCRGRVWCVPFSFSPCGLGVGVPASHAARPGWLKARIRQTGSQQKPLGWWVQAVWDSPSPPSPRPAGLGEEQWGRRWIEVEELEGVDRTAVQMGRGQPGAGVCRVEQEPGLLRGFRSPELPEVQASPQSFLVFRALTAPPPSSYEDTTWDPIQGDLCLLELVGGMGRGSGLPGHFRDKLWAL